MPLTIVSAQAQLARRLGEYAGLVDLVDLLGVGYRSAGLTQDDLSALTDTDMDRVTADDLDQVLDVAQVEGLERIIANLDPERLRSLGITEDPAAIERRLRLLVATMRVRIDRMYGVGLQRFEGGILTYDFAQRGDETCSGELG